MSGLLEAAINENENANNEGFYFYVNEAVALWQKAEKALAILLKHETTTDIDKSFMLLKGCAENREREEALKACYDARAMLAAILASEVPSVKNIF